MDNSKYVVGIDFGTESGRAILVDIGNGEVITSYTVPYPNGVIDKKLPNTNSFLNADFALQDPQDYLFVLTNAVKKIMTISKISPSNVIGIGIDFTACTILPTDHQLVPLCYKPQFKDNPHAWTKLWKHHAAQSEANKMNEIALLHNEHWIKRYGGKISSEWMIPKVWQILNEAPEVFEGSYYFLEAVDWIVAKMTGEIKRSSCAAGYKGTWNKQDGYLSPKFLSLLNPKLKDIYQTKLAGDVASIGEKAGELTAEMAEMMGLNPGTAVAVGIIDAHAAVPGMGVTEPEKMVIVMGTSSCHMLLSEQEVLVEGISGVVEDGIIPGIFAYEAGQAAVGDVFGWFVDKFAPAYLTKEADREGISIHQLLEKKASKLRPGESGLVALDWHNGNRTPLVDADLSGLIMGLTLSTSPEEIYRTLIEATAFGTRAIIETFQLAGVGVKEIYACGGLPHRNALLMQIYADVMNMEIKISDSINTSALGAAMYGAVAAGEEAGGYKTIQEAAAKMAKLKEETIRPIKENVEIYEQIYREYILLQDYFGRGVNNVMKRLKEIKNARLRNG